LTVIKGDIMTEKLFWRDPYLTKCKAQVTEINGNTVKLDKTILYAFSGGQESDHGSIGALKVVNAVKLGDRENIIDIEYELEEKPNFKVGDEVEVVIDKERREKLMKLHSATHIAYYFITEKYGKLKVLGSNISEVKGRFDVASDFHFELEDIEEKLNSFLLENHEIERTDDENSPDLKWWHCGKWKMPCGGTHVKSTREIGKVKLKRVTKGKGKERIEIYLNP
jgi:Ser-tRNA(Ala) deacylase AlaX